MTTPDLKFWMQLFVRLALEVMCVAVVALLAERLLRAAQWRRIFWQGAVVCLLLLTTSEVSGFGRGLASCLFGHAPIQPKIVDGPTGPERLAQEQTIPAISFSGVPEPISVSLPHPKTQIEAEVSRPVWWPGLIWLTGGLMIVGRMVTAQLIFISLRRRPRRIMANDLHERVADILRRLGARRKICLIESPALASPIAFGICRPSIGLPSDFADKYGVAEQNVMLAHELAHLAAHDPLWYAVADLISAALWWHPFVWWTRRRLQYASELAADEAAVILPGGPATLAECLVTLGKQLIQRRAVNVIGVEGSFRSNLGERVHRLIAMSATVRQPSFAGKSRAVRAGVIFAGCLLTVTAVGSLQNRDTQNQATLQANLRHSWNASPLSIVWQSSFPAGADIVAPPPTLAVPVPVEREAATEKASMPPILPDAKPLAAAVPESATYSVENDPVWLDSKPPAATPVKQDKMSDHEKPAPPSPGKDASRYATNGIVHTNTGRNEIIRRLNEIKLAEQPEEFQTGLPLSVVLAVLNRISVANDPADVGVNFMFKPRGNPNTTVLLDPMAPSPAPADPTVITIKINPTINNLTLRQTLDAICEVSDTPISYSVDDNAVWFYVKPHEDPALETRRFHINPFTFLQALQDLKPSGLSDSAATTGHVGGRLGEGGLGGGLGGLYPVGSGIGLPEITTPFQTRTNNIEAAAYFANLGINLTNNGRAVIFNQRTGDLLVRATADDLDKVVQVLEQLNKVPQLVRFDIKSVTLPVGHLLGLEYFPLTNNSATNKGQFTLKGILTDVEFRFAMQQIEHGEDTDILSYPRVTTENERPAHVAVMDAATNGTGWDCIPNVSSDGESIHLDLTFLSASGTNRYSIATKINLWDGQTAILGGITTATGAKPAENLLLFVTVRLIDPAGNHLHPDTLAKPPPPQPETGAPR